MFDIGFLELLLILVIALLVIGPERMPELARKIGSFMGKTRRFVNSMKEDSQVQDTLREIQDSMNLEDEKKQIDTVGQELEQGLKLDDVNMDELQRPTFGGTTDQSASKPVGNQFNRAPAQPQIPDTEATNNTDSLKAEQTTSETKESNISVEAPKPPSGTDKTENLSQQDNQKS